MKVTFSAVMERFWLVAFLTITSFKLADLFILPLKTTNGSLDVEHLVGHMTLLEQTVTGFQQTIKSQDADIAALKTEIAYMKASYNLISGHATEITSLKTGISTLKANQQVITSHHADIATLKTEMVNLKANQQKLDTRISDLQRQGQPSRISAEMTSLKNEVDVSRTEVSQVSNEMTSLTSKFNNLTQDYKTLSWQVKTQQNLTIPLHALQDTLSRVLGHVQRAADDRLLLHSSVNKLNKTIQEFGTNFTATMTGLSAEIALLKTEVGFNIWLGPSNVKLHPSNYTTLKFRDIQYNKGDGYNATTGVFTAPVSGTYLLWTHVYEINGSEFYLYLKKGNSYIGRFYTITAKWATGSVITTTAVTAGEQVSVTVLGADIVACCYYSRFGGALLYRH